MGVPELQEGGAQPRGSVSPALGFGTHTEQRPGRCLLGEGVGTASFRDFLFLPHPPGVWTCRLTWGFAGKQEREVSKHWVVRARPGEVCDFIAKRP